MNPKLLEAVAIFKALGWEKATPENILTLPLGTAEQKQTALSGLKSGDFGEIKQIKPNTYGWVSSVDVDEGILALFAVRIGVDARRAANILKASNTEMLVDVLSSRGAKYASDFIGFACVSRRRMYEHSASVFGNLAVWLVDRLNLDIPQSVEYMKDWSVYAASAMGLEAETLNKENLPNIDLIGKRFENHIETGVAMNTPATGPFGAVLPQGVKRGLLSHEKAVELVFSALDASIRPGDRKVWLDVLDELNVGENELSARTQALIPILASGDAAASVKLAPILIAHADSALLTEVITAAFSVTSKKARQLVLKSALERPCPDDAENLAPWLTQFSNGTDKTIASLATKLIKQWDIGIEVIPSEKQAIQGLWQSTPAVWTPPTFALGEVSPEALTELAATIINRAAVVHDELAERFLALANAVAYQNPEAARTSLRGIKQGDSLLNNIICWVKGEEPKYRADLVNNKGKEEIKSPLVARDYVVCLQLGKLPCLLSTPSRVDLSISVSDLLARLQSYQESKIDALEADLFLALTRLDLKTVTTQATETLKKLNIPVLMQSGRKMKVSAGQAVVTYINVPIKEPKMTLNQYSRWGKIEVSISDAMPGFPDRFSGYYQEEFFSVFPLWGDTALRDIRWDSEVYHEKGLILRQVARRQAPLPAGASINLLAAQRSSTPDAAADSMKAVTEAWERGLLRPGVADISLLDWNAGEPYNLAALSVALDGIAQDGILAVVWPILDALVLASLKAPRLIAGTAELAELIFAFLPEVQIAVKEKMADEDSLNLPGIRALALRSGSSRAVSAAQKIVTLLPPMSNVIQKDAESIAVMEVPFEEIWPAQKSTLEAIDDSVTITVDWANPDAPTRLFLFSLRLPDISDRIFQIVNNGWHYDLDSEGQCQAYAVSPDSATFARDKQNQVWLHWDKAKNAMVVCDKRNWAGGSDGPLKGVQIPTLSTSLLTVIIGLLAQDGDAVYYAPRLLRQFIESGEINDKLISSAMQTLLKSPVVSPAKLVRELEKDIKTLYVLWPMLTESIKKAGVLAVESNSPPVWINRVLDIALRYAPYLAEASKRGLIPAKDAAWSGLQQIASSKAKSTAVVKAKKLLAVLV